MEKQRPSAGSSHWQADVAAGFVVFLVALPLCLGIALASGAPVFAGLLSGAVAGLVVSWLSGSALSVSGPAAGLTVIVAGGIAQLGSWQSFLTATVIAGCFQIFFGIIRSGRLAAFFPNSVIKGMLAAIGLTIIFKQIPHALGWDHDYEGDESFLEVEGHSNTFKTIIDGFSHMTPGALAVTICGVAIMLFWSWPKIKNHKLIKLIPAPLVVVLCGILVNKALDSVSPDLRLTAEAGHLVSVPIFKSWSAVIAGLTLPDFSVVNRMDVWQIALTLAAVASLETLLSIEAVDRMDPDRRVSDCDRELLAQGTGNIICGLLGGLVMTSVIVRSSANVYAGGRSRLSSVMHGLFMLCSLLFLAPMLNQIPLAALAVVLIAVGLKLVSPSVIRGVWKLGPEQFMPFVVTIVAVVLTDLLTGVALGWAVAMTVIIKMNHHQAITVVNDGAYWLVRFAKDVSFAHKARLKQVLASIPENSDVLIDGLGAQFIDFDIMEEIKDFLDVAPKRGIRARWRNLRSKRMKLRGDDSGKLQEPSFGEQGVGEGKASGRR